MCHMKVGFLPSCCHATTSYQHNDSLCFQSPCCHRLRLTKCFHTWQLCSCSARTTRYQTHLAVAGTAKEYRIFQSTAGWRVTWGWRRHPHGVARYFGVDARQSATTPADRHAVTGGQCTVCPDGRWDCCGKPEQERSEQPKRMRTTQTELTHLFFLDSERLKPTSHEKSTQLNKTTPVYFLEGLELRWSRLYFSNRLTEVLGLHGGGFSDLPTDPLQTSPLFSWHVKPVCMQISCVHISIGCDLLSSGQNFETKHNSRQTLN